MDGVLLLITGASGAGKTSVREAIAADLAPTIEAVELHHLDAIPACPDVAWRQRMAERAVVRARALDSAGRHLLLAGDPVAPGEVLAAPSAPAVDIAVCLLDVTETAQRERLRRRGDPEHLLPHHVAFASWLRRHAEDPEHVPHVITTGGWADMQVTADRPAPPELADDGDRRIGDEQGRGRPRCAAVDSRRYRGSGAGLSSGPWIGVPR